MKKSLFWIIGIGLVITVIVVLFAKPELYKGQMIAPKPAKIITCGNQWTKVFEGNYNQEIPVVNSNLYSLVVNTAITHPQLQTLVRNGCDFKLIVDTQSGGGNGPQSFECSVVSAYAGPADVAPQTDVFSCNTDVYSPDGKGSDGYSDGKRLVFQNGTVYFQPLGNQPDPSGPLTLSLFVKK